MEESSSDLVLDKNQGDNDRKIFELEQRRAEIIDSNNWENTKEIENHPDIIPKAVEWASNKSNVTIISQSWMQWMDEFTTEQNKNL